MNILGISGILHDGSACLIQDGQLVAAVEEERFRRVKHVGFMYTGGLPFRSIEFCLRQAGISWNDIDHVGYFFQPWKEFYHNIRYRLFHFLKSPKTSAYMSVGHLHILRDHLKAEQLFNIRRNKPVRFHYLSHHMTHAAGSFFVSGLEEAALLNLDAIGEWATTTMGQGEGNRIRILKEQFFPHSWGWFYAMMTQYLGFVPYNDEYKVMGLASFGEPSYYDQLRQVMAFRINGDFRVNTDYLNPYRGLPHYFTEKFNKTFGPPRGPEEDIEPRHKDIAASLQRLLEDTLLVLSQHLYQRTKSSNLCIAGGVGLNCSANGRLLEMGPFKNIYVPPTPYDAGCALGAAYYIYHSILNQPRRFILRHAYWGPGFSDEEIQRVLDGAKLNYEYHEDIVELTVQALAEGKIVGWFQGRMEWGPRALGARSILANPTLPEMQDVVNRWVKFREDFRPFAPSVLKERAQEYFEISSESPFMLFICKVKESKRRAIPAVTHVDGTARPQTVDRADAPLYYRLIEAFGKRTGVPVLLNTSFNIKGEPIVCTPFDAVRCFYSTGIDVLAMGNYFLRKNDS